ncbi:large conductance mechanosensitive channel protein MscL [Hyphomonas sp.]|uniref:large conductance mechanosensitive channel protein MscL n=1 Tax=Hyphomonas sp. TaxID=87 RepID=UPI00391D8108
MFKEFKEFAMKGNLIDMAVAFVMGGAFATVVTAFIQGVFLPVLAPIMGGIDLSSLKFTVVGAEVNAAGEVVREAAIVEFGGFISATISFLIVAFAMFLIIKGMNSMKAKEEAAPPPPPPRQEVLLEEIRNLLAKDR